MRIWKLTEGIIRRLNTQNHPEVLDFFFIFFFSASEFSAVVMFRLEHVLLGDVSSSLYVTERSWFVTKGPTDGSNPVRHKQAEASDY